MISELKKKVEEEAATFEDLGNLKVFVYPAEQQAELQLTEYAEDDEEEEQQELPPELRSVEEMPWKYIKTEDDDGYVSLIINDDGPSDLWAETYPPIPDKYPDEWNEKVWLNSLVVKIQ